MKSRSSLFSKNLLKNSSGMTLLEIMIVLAILGGLIGILATQVTKQLAKARVKEAKIQMSELHKALDMFYTDCGFYPSAEQGLQALVEAPGDCNSWGPDPYIKNVQKDPWQNDFLYERGENGYPILITFGEDRREGGTGYNADITSDDLGR